MNLEQAILGACLIENAYGKVHYILKPVNFSTTAHQAIWAAMGKIYPQPIDLLTVQRHLGTSYSYTLAHITAHVYSSANIVQWAFILLEAKFREQLVSIINKYRLQYSKDILIIPHLDDALTYTSDHTHDIFDTIPALYRFFKAKQLPAIADDIEEMNDHINKRLMHIKAYDQREHLQRQLAILDDHLKTMEDAA